MLFRCPVTELGTGPIAPRSPAASRIRSSAAPRPPTPSSSAAGSPGARRRTCSRTAGSTSSCWKPMRWPRAERRAARGSSCRSRTASTRSVEQLAGRRAARTAWKEASRGAIELAATLRKLKIGDVTPGARRDQRADERRRRAAAAGAGHAQSGGAGGAVPGRGSGAGADPRGIDGRHPAAERIPCSIRCARHSDSRRRRRSRARASSRSSAVRRTRFTRKTADVLLAGGTIRTKLIVVATGGPGAVFGQLRRHVREQQGFGVVDRPPAVGR